ncbi:CotH kinase family protein [Granulosicoccus sp. 3-233]|uniref:CotH kinase family protein n=1 Tax=Granulosicoccus sp. 3-233 TaxID=3417969 RepID=UPI003D3307BE
MIFAGLSWLLLSVSASAAAPSAPGSLRYENYSSTSGEVFWNRASDDGLVVYYEIKVNDTLIGNRDVLSHYFRSLVEGEPYTVAVTSIDDQGNRSATATVSFVAGGGTVTVGTIAAPTGVKASVYSSTSAEIMWDRPSTFGLSHEISRNGSVVSRTSGISHYDNQLSPGTSYTYRVVAIDRSGKRSDAASVSLTTRGGTTTPISVAVPTGLKASVYSSTSAEIMWDRPATFGLSYEISRNGEQLSTTNGISHYDDNLQPDTTYNYDVVAIDRNGNRSLAASVMLDTPASNQAGNGADNTEWNIADVSPDIVEPADVYTRDGYDPVEVLRVDVRTETTPGICTADDLSGCTLDDVMADVDKTDDLTVDIPIHVTAADFPEDGLVSNAELRMRGSGSRNGAQKSLRIKLDSKKDLWRGERYFQLNKHPFDGSRIRNKLATDVMAVIPGLPSLRTQFVNLWIDDGEGPVDYGLFTHVERVNEHYLEKRDWDDDGNIYKAEDFRFNTGDLSDILVDDEGEPLDEDRFETSLSIENGKDHRALQAMLKDLNDPDISFETVLDQYFDRNNVLAWVATNILVHQADAVRHNFILYNPTDTEKFYFLPWDYDEAMGLWKEPPTDLSNDSLRQRSEYGYGLAARNVFLEGFYRLPGIHEEIVEAVDYLRQNVVTDQFMTEKVDAYFALVQPFQERLPDSEHNPNFQMGSAVSYASAPGMNAEALRNTFRAPIGAIQQDPVKRASDWLFSWTPAFDVTGTSGGISYRLQVATTPTFDADTVAVDVGGIPDAAGIVSRTVDTARLPTGDYYARVFAIPANEPERFFQVSGNKLYVGSNTYYGAIGFSVD